MSLKKLFYLPALVMIENNNLGLRDSQFQLDHYPLESEFITIRYFSNRTTCRAGSSQNTSIWEPHLVIWLSDSGAFWELWGSMWLLKSSLWISRCVYVISWKMTKCYPFFLVENADMSSVFQLRRKLTEVLNKGGTNVKMHQKHIGANLIEDFG